MPKTIKIKIEGASEETVLDIQETIQSNKKNLKKIKVWPQAQQGNNDPKMVLDFIIEVLDKFPVDTVYEEVVTFLLGLIFERLRTKKSDAKEIKIIFKNGSEVKIPPEMTEEEVKAELEKALK